jgi:serine/threonine protein kinase/tetratricopeptide (TPR) repeat protein
MDGAAADRNLLLGIIALQMDFISRDALIAAMNAWVLKKETALSQILEEQGALTASRHSLLDALVTEHIRVHQGDPQKSLAALSSIGSVRGALTQIADTDVQASLPLVAATREVEDADRYRTVPQESLGESSSTGTRFRVLRPHARGGLGQVSVALDRELDRQVALKEIQERLADDITSRARFVQEAEITGKLEHPGIIPVYGLGHDAAGRPFYAMRFIEGDSLGEAITAFHGDQALKQTREARISRLRDLLRRFTDVCNAVAYAHSRGVLHRDLKPGNIMLGPYGETLVVDWGLAKASGSDIGGMPSSDSKPGIEPLSREGPIRLSGQSGSRADTVAGSPIGTPAFASPEQVTGAMDRLGPATDIYGLGATLYALLTGRPPVVSGDLLEVIRRVRKGEIPQPTSIDATVPKPLEAICKKAMALEPEARYPSARALAEDVTRWLDDRPVSSYHEPVSVRAGRWIRRHQRVMSSAVAAILVGLIAVWIAYSRESRVNQKLRIEIVKNKISSLLDRFDGSEGTIDEVASQIEDLARLAPGEVAQERQSLEQHVTTFIQKLIRQERALAPTDIDRIQRAMARAKDHAPKSVRELELTLQERLGKLNPVFALANPFDGLPAIFPLDAFRLSGPGLKVGASGPAGGNRLVRSRVTSEGDVEIEATFTLMPDLVAGMGFGLALDAGDDHGYRFTLSSDGQIRPGRLTMTVQRNNVVLRQTGIELAGTTVRLFAQKKGDTLGFTIGKTALGFIDIFPLSAVGPGYFGVVLSAGVRLDSLEARKRQLPAAPSRLEKGDALYSQRVFDGALEEFERVVNTTDVADVKQEATYKKALCLVELGRAAEASPILEKLATDKSRWATLATCQVWKILLKTNTPKAIEEADRIVDSLNANVDFADLALILAEDERDAILSYYRQVDHDARINWTASRVRNLRRALDIEALIKADRVTRQRTLWRLADAYRLDGRESDAVDTIEKLLASHDLLTDDRLGITRDYASMMIIAKTPGKALKEIEKHLGNGPADPTHTSFPMLVDRARLQAALGNFDQAEADVARFIETVDKPKIAYNDFAEACLFRGFLLERRGLKEEASRAWRAGLRKNWPKDLAVISTGPHLDGKALRDNFGSLLHFEMLASLTRDLEREDAESIVRESMGSGDFTQSPIVKYFDRFRNNDLLNPEHLTAIALEIYGSPIAQEFARNEAYLKAPLGDRFNKPLVLAVEAEIRLNAIPDGNEPALAGLIDEGLDQIARSVQDSQISLPQLMFMMSAWTGRADFLGWGGLEASMKNQLDLRGRLAYVYGRRFLVLKQPAVARHLFELTLRDIPAQSPFRKLAQDQLAKMGAK